MEDSSTINLEVSCPVCGSMIVSQKALENEDTTKLPKEVAQMLEVMIGVSKHYAFNGRTQCECGNMVMTCLTVSAHGANSMIKML